MKAHCWQWDTKGIGSWLFLAYVPKSNVTTPGESIHLQPFPPFSGVHIPTMDDFKLPMYITEFQVR